MTPDYRVSANGKEITQTIQDRLISLTVLDEAGLLSDTLILELDNRENRVGLPSTGAVIEVWMGYKENGLATMGRFMVNEIRVEGPPETLTLVANAADMKEGFKERKERSWHDISIGDVVSTIASEHGYTARVSPELVARSAGYLHQSESDLHFLTRLAKEHGAMAKTAGSRLLFLPRGTGTSASGTKIPSVKLAQKDLEHWAMGQTDRKKYRATLAFWQDLDHGVKAQTLIGSGSPVRVLPDPSPNAEAARQRALTSHQTDQGEEARLDIACPGRFDLMVETPLEITGIAPGVDGPWVVDRVTHRMDRKGYTLHARARQPRP